MQRRAPAVVCRRPGRHYLKDSWLQGLASGRPLATQVESTSSRANSAGLSAAVAGRIVQQSNSVFARVRGDHIPVQQLVEALGRLAGLARDTSQEDLALITKREPFRHLITELLKRLPRDSAEGSSHWEGSWTGTVAESLITLQAHSASPAMPQLCTRLGHTLLQAGPEMELETLLNTVCTLCALDGQGGGVDDYALWVLGSRLEELCKTREPSIARLAPLLHLFAHPKTRARVAARASQVVLQRVKLGLPESNITEVAKLLQVYSDVPSVTADVLGVLAKSPQRLEHANLPELAVVAEALTSQEMDRDTVALAIARRLATLLKQCVQADGGGLSAVHEELATSLAASLVTILKTPNLAELREAAQVLGERLMPGAGPRKAETLAQLLSVGLHLEAQMAEADRFTFLSATATALETCMAELSDERLAKLAEALAEATVELDSKIFTVLRSVATSQAPNMAPEHFSRLALALGRSGMLTEDVLKAFDVEACLARLPACDILASIAWCLAVVESNSKVAWELLTTAFGARGAEWKQATSEERGMMYQALASQRAMLGDSWKRVGPAAEALDNKSWKEDWQKRRDLVSPPSQQGAMVAKILTDLQMKFERDITGGKKNPYVMPFLLPDHSVVIDLLTSPARHPVSREAKGDLQLRHSVWSTAEYSVLAIADSTWTRLVAEDDPKGETGETEELRRDWLRQKIDSIVREDQLSASNLAPEITGMLRGVPLGPDGLNKSGLDRLTQEPLEVQKRAVRKLVDSMNSSMNIKSLTGYLIGVIKREKEAVAQEEEKQKTVAQSATMPRPKDGWEHPDAKPLSKVEVGSLVFGKITNVMGKRYWLSFGCEKDASFTGREGEFYVGDEVVDIKITDVDIQKKRISAQTTKTTRRPARQRKSKPNRTDGASDSSQGATNLDSPKGEEAEWPAAAVRPRLGWDHKSGKPLAQLKVGDLVGGRVTNMLHHYVWVNIGAVKDACFLNNGGTYKVGDVVEGLPIISINLEKERVVIESPPAG